MPERFKSPVKSGDEHGVIKSNDNSIDTQTVSDSLRQKETIDKFYSKEYFDLQLGFAKFVAEKTHQPLAAVLVTHTQFHALFGQGLAEGNSSDNPFWKEYINEAVIPSLGDQKKIADATYAFYLKAPNGPPSYEVGPFGCFGFEYHSDINTIEIHFRNRDKDGTSPLSPEKLERRKKDLADMFGYIRDAKDTDGNKLYPDEAEVAGSSHLYDPENRNIYQALFPENYIASREMQKRKTFKGGGVWGQFVDFKGNVQQKAREKFLQNLSAVENMDELYLAFPRKTWEVHAPVKDFYARFL